MEACLYVATMHITTENRSSGAFSGTITSPVGVETMKGTVTGTTMTFTINLGNGTEKGTAGRVEDRDQGTDPGDLHQLQRRQGTIVATRTST